MVPEVGLEPTWAQGPGDFESPASTSFTTPASGESYPIGKGIVKADIILYTFTMRSDSLKDAVKRAAALLRGSGKTAAFTGAGISVESGIPDFRGPDGVWSKIDTKYLDLRYFKRHREECWPVIHEMFFKPLQAAQPNAAHEGLAWMEQQGLLAGVITQNIDNLHHKAGSQTIVEFHGNTRQLVCTHCGHQCPADFSTLGFPPTCPKCGTILKPDFVFFGEGIPFSAWRGTEELLNNLEVMLVIGTTGVVFPAGQIPRQAKRNGAKVIEINLEPSAYTQILTDIFIQAPATRAISALKDELTAQQGHSRA